jgi:hypothetical protein
MSDTPEIKIGVLLGSPAGVQVLVTWTSGLLVSSGMPFRGSDMSLMDMSLESVSEETAGLDRSEPVDVGLSDPLGLFG